MNSREVGASRVGPTPAAGHAGVAKESQRSLDLGEAHGAPKSRDATRRAKLHREGENRVAPLGITEAGESGG